MIAVKMAGLREAQMIRTQGYCLWIAELETMEANVIREHQDAFFIGTIIILTILDANHLHMKYLQIAQNVEWGDATHIEAYIEIGQLLHEYKHNNGIFRRKRWSDAEICARQEYFFPACQMDTTRTIVTTSITRRTMRASKKTGQAASTEKSIVPRRLQTGSLGREGGYYHMRG